VKPSRRQSRLQDSLHPPENVRVVDSDGVEYPVQTVYVETDRDGIQVFEVVDAPDRQLVRILADVLPGLTEIRLRAEQFGL
jgi:hypothetical protein